MYTWQDTFVWLQNQVEARLAKTKTYNIAINACGKGANWLASLVCFQDLRAAGLLPDAVTCNSIITACTRGSGWPTSLAFLHKLWPAQLSPDIFTLSAAICACATVLH